jgi:S-adenosylmethionine:tRNA ribosyltransferase-isomerase
MEITAEHSLTTRDFDYELPEKLIAQFPAERRDSSRLMVVHRATGSIEDRMCSDLPEYLAPGEALILNDTRVRKARLLGTKEGSDGRVEVLLQRKLEPTLFQVMVRTNHRLALGTRVRFSEKLSGQILARNDGLRVIRFNEPRAGELVDDYIRETALLPLPPYVKREPVEEDQERYQTVYARREGAIAAPTAGLHFTQELLDRVRSRQIETVSVTLHVGNATFQPVKVEELSQHRMYAEEGEISAEAAWYINQSRQNGGRLVAVVTTTCRLLEFVAKEIQQQRRLKAEHLLSQQKGKRGRRPAVPLLTEAAPLPAASGRLCRPFKGRVDLFIYPPYAFQVADMLLTNFHLPRSTLLMLASAFAGVDLVRRAYQEAVEREYRFFSYGDAMLML